MRDRLRSSHRFSAAGIAGQPLTYDANSECPAFAGESFFLRPYPTFDTVGTRYPNGTQIVIVGTTPHQRNGGFLWKIRLPFNGNATGYAYFTEGNEPQSDAQNACSDDVIIPQDTTPLRGSTPATPRGTGPAAPVLPRPPTSNGIAGKVLGLGALAVLGATGAWYLSRRRRGRK